MTLMRGLEKEDCKWHLERAGGVLSKAVQARQAKVISAEKINGTQAINDDSKPERLVLCINGGGTKCAVAAENEAGEIEQGESGPCNV
jgi:N-acetylmuramic acid 6-phosphate etherase